MKLLIALIAVILVPWLTIGQKVSAPDDASIKDHVYSNRFFNFTYTYPQNWVVHGEPTNQHLREVGKQRITTSGALTAEESDLALKNTFQLLTVFQHALGTPGLHFNPSVMVVAEDVRFAPGIKDGRTYFEYVRPLVQKSGGQLVQPQPIEMKVSGRSYFRHDIILTVNGQQVHQAMVVGVEKGYILAFVFTSDDPSRVSDLVQSLNSVRFG